MEQAQQLAGVLRDSGRALCSRPRRAREARRRRRAPEEIRDARARGRPALPGRARLAVRQRDRPDVRPPLEGHLRCAGGGDRPLPDRRQQHREHRRQALLAAVATPSSSRADAASSAGRARGGWISSSSGAGWSASSAPTCDPVDRALAGREVEVEPQRVDARALIGGAPARAEVVVDVEDARDVEDRRDHPVQRGPAEAGDRRWRGRCRGRAPTAVESSRRASARTASGFAETVSGPGIDRSEVLERELDADPLGGPARTASDRVSASRRSSARATVDDHLRVVDDLLGAALGRVGERSGERPVRRPVAGEEVAGRVEDGPQPVSPSAAADRPGVTDAAAGVGEDRASAARVAAPSRSPASSISASSSGRRATTRTGR